MRGITRTIAVLVGVVAAIVPAVSAGAAGVVAKPPANVLYNSLVASPGNLPSEAFEATQTSQFGNEVTLSRAARVDAVVITMSSWGCQAGTWTGDNCVTTPGSTFSEPITLDIFQAPANPNTDGGLPGALILSVTKTFAIPYRPSANAIRCSGGDAGAWYDSKLGSCFNGLATNVTFNLTSLRASLPKTIVFGIAYNTSDYGANPYGDVTACHSTTEGCGYDSLNVGLSNDPTNLNRGVDPYPGTVWQNTATASNYCDGGAAGTGMFRFDSPGTTPCWGAGSSSSEAPWYIPAVQVTAAV